MSAIVGGADLGPWNARFAGDDSVVQRVAAPQIPCPFALNEISCRMTASDGDAPCQ